MTRPYIEDSNIGTAYRKALEVALDHPPHLTIHISNPISSVSDVPDSNTIDDCDDILDDWEDVLNLGATYDSYCNFVFPKNADSASDSCSNNQNSCLSGGNGKDWIKSRIHEQFCGKYNEQAQEQYETIIERISKDDPNAGWSNALVAQVYQSEDLEKASESPFPRSSCLTQMQFKPERGKLNLFTTFRSQYFDTKAYGNLIALTILLAKTCEKTGYEPGYLVETANNVILKDKATAQDLHDQLLSAVVQ